jgi:hypothetical protein
VSYGIPYFVSGNSIFEFAQNILISSFVSSLLVRGVVVELLALGAEVGGIDADLVTLREAGIEPGAEMLKTFR